MRLLHFRIKILTPCHCPGLLFLGLALQCSVLLTVGIKLEKVAIPKVGIIGQTVSLECDFRLESDKLYSLKWYKDGHEFFRYLPFSGPSTVIFPIPGVLIDVHTHQLNSTGGRNHVSLRRLDLASSGVYKCEVSSESPFFQTLYQESNLTIIIPPNPLNPRLSKFPKTVHMRDIIIGNCTSYRSFPPANLTFYLNGEKWTGSNVTVYEPQRELPSSSEEGHLHQKDGLAELWTSVLGLRFRVESSLFTKGAIRIKCVASILDKEWETRKIITHQNYNPPQTSSGRNQYSSGSLRSQSRGWTLTICCLFNLVTFIIILYSTETGFDGFV